MVFIKEFNKDISINVEFDTDRIAFGRGYLSYQPKKLGNNKSMQRSNVLKQLKRNKEQLEVAIKLLESEEK